MLNTVVWFGVVLSRSLAGVPNELTVAVALRRSCPGVPLLAALAMACCATHAARPEAIGGATFAETLQMHAPHVGVGAMALGAVAVTAFLTDDVVRAVLRKDKAQERPHAD